MDEQTLVVLIFFVILLLISVVESVIIAVAIAFSSINKAIMQSNVFGNSVGEFRNFAKTKVIITKASQRQITYEESNQLWELEKRNGGR